MAEVYKYKGFYIFDNRHPYENDIDGKKMVYIIKQ